MSVGRMRFPVKLILIIACLALLASCDSSSDTASIGGQGQTSGYSTADLAGRWGGIYTRIDGSRNGMTIWFDAQGKLTAVNVNGQPPGLTLRGRVSVDPSGALSGVTVTYLGNTQGERLDWSKMKLISPTQIKGSWVVTHTSLPAPFRSAASLRKQ